MEVTRREFGATKHEYTVYQRMFDLREGEYEVYLNLLSRVKRLVEEGIHCTVHITPEEYEALVKIQGQGDSFLNFATEIGELDDFDALIARHKEADEICQRILAEHGRQCLARLPFKGRKYYLPSRELAILNEFGIPIIGSNHRPYSLYGFELIEMF